MESGTSTILLPYSWMFFPETSLQLEITVWLHPTLCTMVFFTHKWGNILIKITNTLPCLKNQNWSRVTEVSLPGPVFPKNSPQPNHESHSHCWLSVTPWVASQSQLLRPIDFLVANWKGQEDLGFLLVDYCRLHWLSLSTSLFLKIFPKLVRR